MTATTNQQKKYAVYYAFTITIGAALGMVGFFAWERHDTKHETVSFDQEDPSRDFSLTQSAVKFHAAPLLRAPPQRPAPYASHAIIDPSLERQQQPLPYTGDGKVMRNALAGIRLMNTGSARVSDVVMQSYEEYQRRRAGGGGGGGPPMGSPPRPMGGGPPMGGPPMDYGNQYRDSYRNMNPRDMESMNRVREDVWRKAQNMPGVTAPLGFWDPLGFCADTTEGRLCFYRECEIKHGRLAMLATVGFAFAEHIHPFWGGKINVPSVHAWEAKELASFWPAVWTAAAIPELLSLFTFKNPLDGSLWEMREDYELGNVGWDPMDLKPRDPREFFDMQSKEINNGRLAMIAFAGMVAQELATGKKLW